MSLSLAGSGMGDSLKDMSAIYRYEGLEAELYDSLDELSDFEDVAFFQWFVDSLPGPILDLGCGTGRLLLPLVEKGHEVVGLDGAPVMLDQCRRRLAEAQLDAELVLGDMRGFDLGDRKFGSILVPGFSIQMLLEDEEVAACFDCCRKHLREDGQLIVPTHMPWEMIWDGRDECPLEERKTVELEGTGERLIASQGWAIDKERQRLALSNRYERKSRDGKSISMEEKEMTIRWHMPHDMMQLLAESGFGDVSVYGDFEFEPPESESESIIYLARI